MFRVLRYMAMRNACMDWDGIMFNFVFKGVGGRSSC